MALDVMSDHAGVAVERYVYKFRLDLTGFVNRGWAVRLHEAVGSHAACINFSFATGSVSMKVAIGVLP